MKITQRILRGVFVEVRQQDFSTVLLSLLFTPHSPIRIAVAVPGNSVMLPVTTALLAFLCSFVAPASAALNATFSGTATIKRVTSLDRDDSGSVFMSGQYYSGTLFEDGAALRVCAANTECNYLSSYGDVRWTAQWVTPASTMVRSNTMRWHKASNTLGVVGFSYLSSSLTLGSWGNLAAAGTINFDAFVVRSNATNGAVLWAKRFISIHESNCHDSGVSLNGIMVVACFYRTASFRWGTGGPIINLIEYTGNIVVLGVDVLSGSLL